jgi:hypothetical protein
MSQVVNNVTCQLTIRAGDNGKISPEGEFVVAKFSHVYLHAQPEQGYQVQMWYVNGKQLYGGTKQFRVTADEDEMDIHVTFSKM